MRPIRNANERRGRRAATVALVLCLPVWGLAALASASTISTSTFEIDDATGVGSNLVVDGTNKSDWRSVSTTANVTNETFDYVADTSGQADNSFGNGTKEDTTVPSVVSGGIPPNKSDLKEFFVYVERVGAKSYLNLAWSRVQDPSGTTNMDFELNQSSLTHGNGVPKRTQDDLLITYDLSRGGAHPTLGFRKWNGNDTSGAWGAYQQFDSSIAIGSINEQALGAVTAPNGATYGPYSARTFGEASIDLNEADIFNPASCTSFGQAYLKSRSSDSFTSALKDYVAPVPTAITNCGRAIVHKTNSATSALLDGATFTVAPGNAATPSVTTVPALVVDGQAVAGVFCIDKLLFGTQYTFTESDEPDGFSGADPQTFTPTTSGNCANVTAATTATLTFANTPLRGSILVKKTTSDGSVLDGATFGYRVSSSTGTFTAMAGVSGQAGWFCVDGLEFATYTVRETAAPTGYNPAANQNHTVSSASTCAARTSPQLGTPDLTFVNNPAPGTITISKRDDASPPNPLAGVEFKLYNDDGTGGAFNTNTVYDSDSVTTGVQALTCTTAALNAVSPAVPGQCQISGVPLGTYWVVETAPPAGHTGAAPQKVTISLGSSAGTGQNVPVTFTNPRTHKVIVLVCHEGTNTLAPSAVTGTGLTSKTTLAATGLTAAQQAALCSTAGASYDALGHGSRSLSVTPGSGAHP